MVTPVLEQQSTSSSQHSGLETTTSLAANAASFTAQGKDVYYQPGTEHITKKARATPTFQHVNSSKFAHSLRENHKDLIAKANQNSQGIDAFFTRIKDEAFGKAKEIVGWIKKTLHIGNNTPPPPPPPSELGNVAGDLLNGTERSVATGAGEALATNVAPKTIGIFGKALGVLGKVGSVIAIPLTLAVGAFQTNRDIKNKDGHKAMKTAGNTVGGIVGGIATGAAEGLIIGGILGIEVPIVGSIVLGIIGAVIGGWLGAKAADKAFGNKLDTKLKADDNAKSAGHEQGLSQSTNRSAGPATGAHATVADTSEQGKSDNFFTNRYLAEQNQRAVTSSVTK